MDEREFMIEFRRWLKMQNVANQKMIEAIERRFVRLGEQRHQERQERRPTSARA